MNFIKLGALAAFVLSCYSHLYQPNGPTRFASVNTYMAKQAAER